MLTSRPWIMSLALFAANVSFAADSSATAAKPTESTAKSPLDGLKYRLVGPFRGGRATGVAGVVSEPNTYYFGAATGGLWKTVDGGTSWKPLWDDFPEAAAAAGSVAAFLQPTSNANAATIVTQSNRFFIDFYQA